MLTVQPSSYAIGRSNASDTYPFVIQVNDTASGRDGRDVVSEHFILAERQGDSWLFGATLTPLPEGTETDA